jgi:hypothetical protein
MYSFQNFPSHIYYTPHLLDQNDLENKTLCYMLPSHKIKKLVRGSGLSINLSNPKISTDY